MMWLGQPVTSASVMSTGGKALTIRAMPRTNIVLDTRGIGHPQRRLCGHNAIKHRINPPLTPDGARPWPCRRAVSPSLS